MRIENLKAKSQKSFYGKALIKYADNGDIILQSYDTDVCKIHNGNFIKLWGGYSATTMKHINDFISDFGIIGGGKKWWDNLPCENMGRKYRLHWYSCLGIADYIPSAIYDTYEQVEKEYERQMERHNPFWYIEIEEV